MLEISIDFKGTSGGKAIRRAQIYPSTFEYKLELPAMRKQLSGYLRT